MTARHLAAQAACATAVLVAANLLVLRLAATTVPRQVLRAGERAAPATDLFLGNSTLADGLDPAAFAAAGPGRRPLDLALGASSPVEHDLIHRQQGRHAGAAVFYGFLDAQLTDPPAGGWDTLVGNRAMAYYVEPAVAVGYYAPDAPLKATALWLAGRVPILVERYAVWARVEKVRRRVGGFGLPPVAATRFGRADDFTALEADPDEFAARCAAGAADRVPLAAPVAAICRRTTAAGGRLFVVEMPLPAGHRRRYYTGAAWQAYRDHLIGLVREAGGVYVAAADWIADDGFADPLHLNTAGAAAFSARLAAVTRPPP